MSTVSEKLLNQSFIRNKGKEIPGTIFKAGESSEHKSISNLTSKATLGWAFGTAVSMLRKSTTNIGWARDSITDEEGVYLECLNKDGDKLYQVFAAVKDDGEAVLFRHHCVGWERPKNPYLCHHTLAAYAALLLHSEPSSEFSTEFSKLTVSESLDIADEESFYKACDSLYFAVKHAEFTEDHLVPEVEIRGLNVKADITKAWFGRNARFEKANVDKTATVPEMAKTSKKGTSILKEDFRIVRDRLPSELEALVPSAKYQVSDLHRQCARRMQIGLAKNVLIHGPSGTGKSVTAEVIANLLGLPLVQYSFSADIRMKDLNGGFGVNPNFGKPIASVLEVKQSEPVPLYDADAVNLVVDSVCEEFYSGELTLPAAVNAVIDAVYEKADASVRGDIVNHSKRALKSGGIEKALAQVITMTAKHIPLPEPEPVEEPETSGEIDQREFAYIEGKFATAVKHGLLFVAEEMNTAYADVISMFNGPLEGKPLYLNNGEVISPHPNFRFIATMNVGDGFEGTKPLNSSLIGRFHRVIELKRIAETEAYNIIKAASGIDEKMGRNIARLLCSVLDKREAENITDGVTSIRQAIELAKEIVQMGTPPVEAAIDTFVNPSSFNADIRAEILVLAKEKLSV